MPKTKGEDNDETKIEENDKKKKIEKTDEDDDDDDDDYEDGDDDYFTSDDEDEDDDLWLSNRIPGLMENFEAFKSLELGFEEDKDEPWLKETLTGIATALKSILAPSEEQSQTPPPMKLKKDPQNLEKGDGQKVSLEDKKAPESPVEKIVAKLKNWI